jgi:hypothetical protein
VWTFVAFVLAALSSCVAVAALWKNSITEHSVRVVLRTVLEQGKPRTVQDEAVQKLLDDQNKVLRRVR